MEKYWVVFVAIMLLAIIVVPQVFILVANDVDPKDTFRFLFKRGVYKRNTENDEQGSRE